MRTGPVPVRSAASAAVLAAALLTLTACTSHAARPGAGAAGRSPAASAVPPGAAARPPGTADPAGTAGSRAAASGRGPAPCRTSSLRAAQTGAEVGAGQYYSRLVFTNVSGSACTLTGYPGVSYAAAGGVRSGNAAQRSAGRVATVLLPPGGSASAVLHDSNGMGGYSPGQCRPAAAEGLRVYPPDQRAALFVPWKTRHCAGAGVHSLTIGPVRGQELRTP